jgi:hypothetical protein
VDGGRTVACYSRLGREFLRHAGLAWLRAVRWPVKAAILDGELFSGEGSEGIDAILEARGRAESSSAHAFRHEDPERLPGRELRGEEAPPAVPAPAGSARWLTGRPASLPRPGVHADRDILEASVRPFQPLQEIAPIASDHNDDSAAATQLLAMKPLGAVATDAVRGIRVVEGSDDAHGSPTPGADAEQRRASVGEGMAARGAHERPRAAPGGRQERCSLARRAPPSRRETDTTNAQEYREQNSC